VAKTNSAAAIRRMFNLSSKTVVASVGPFSRQI